MPVSQRTRLSGAEPGFQNRGGEGVTFGRRPVLIAPQARNPRRGVWRGLPRKFWILDALRYDFQASVKLFENLRVKKLKTFFLVVEK